MKKSTTGEAERVPCVKPSMQRPEWPHQTLKAGLQESLPDQDYFLVSESPYCPEVGGDFRVLPRQRPGVTLVTVICDACSYKHSYITLCVIIGAETKHKFYFKESCIVVHSNGKESDIDEALSDFLRHAPHQAGGLNYKKVRKDALIERRKRQWDVTVKRARTWMSLFSEEEQPSFICMLLKGNNIRFEC
ncbi:unnamed protein product [Mytilus coruscus]|uniref:Uncharacterized protein n=1 Tax=Mytilus coruscus TaxID=42192 RepID=A0A6J8ELC7_MYTCO|nr:unnamed protein product [Mytilus coruscus]